MSTSADVESILKAMASRCFLHESDEAALHLFIDVIHSSLSAFVPNVLEHFHALFQRNSNA